MSLNLHQPNAIHQPLIEEQAVTSPNEVNEKLEDEEEDDNDALWHRWLIYKYTKLALQLIWNMI